MKILLLELSGSDSCSRKPNRYAGAGPSLRRLAENIDDCYLAAEKSCFEEDINEKCISLSREDITNIRNFKPLNLYLFGSGYDVLVYSDHNIVLNTEKPQICWAVGANEKINPEIKHLLLHNAKWQQPIIQNSETKIYEFVLGIDTLAFEERNKRDIVFQCSNHYYQIGSDVLAYWCRHNKITAMFAGPISKDFEKDFLKQIDYEYTFYLSQISEGEKIKLLNEAKVYAGLWTHQINGPTLGVKQALSYGCSIITTSAGIMPEVIENGVNGFIIQNEEEFVNAWKNRDIISQKKCWNKSNDWSTEKMVNSFKLVVEEVIKS